MDCISSVSSLSQERERPEFVQAIKKKIRNLIKQGEWS